MSQSKFQNHFHHEDALGRLAIALAAHPFDYVKILIQLGYEPIAPYPSKTLLGRPCLALPGAFTYLGHIRRTDGFFGIYAGLSYKIAATLLNGFVYVNVNEYQKQVARNKPQDAQTSTSSDGESSSTTNEITAEKVQKLFDNLMRETVSRFIALSVSYPFHLMTIRICAQFVGKETRYDSALDAVKDIYQTGGLGGFYAGFVPRFLGDCCILWVGSSLIFVVTSFLEPESSMKGYVSACINYIVASIMYPFQVVSTVMSVNGNSASSLAAASLNPEYTNWIDCWSNLSQLGQVKRGSALFMRYQVATASAAFKQYQPKREFKHW